MVDTADSKSVFFGSVGSSPIVGNSRLCFYEDTKFLFLGKTLAVKLNFENILLLLCSLLMVIMSP